jgi:hypothetical protein
LVGRGTPAGTRHDRPGGAVPEIPAKTGQADTHSAYPGPVSAARSRTGAGELPSHKRAILVPAAANQTGGRDESQATPRQSAGSAGAGSSGPGRTCKDEADPARRICLKDMARSRRRDAGSQDP